MSASKCAFSDVHFGRGSLFRARERSAHAQAAARSAAAAGEGRREREAIGRRKLWIEDMRIAPMDCRAEHALAIRPRETS